MPNFRDALSHNVPIVDAHGRPTPEFMAKWQQQTQINKAIPAEISTPEQVSAILDLLAATPGALLRRGAAQWQALNSLGDSTKFLNGAGAYAPPVPLNAKGQVLGTTGAALGALAPGADGQVLTADATQPLGLGWASAGGGGGGDTVLADLTASGTTNVISVTGIPTTYRLLRIVGAGRSTGAGTTAVNAGLQLNGDTGMNYTSQYAYSSQGLRGSSQVPNASTLLISEVQSAGSFALAPATFETIIPFYADTVFKKVMFTRWFSVFGTSVSNVYEHSGVGIWNSTAAITQLAFSIPVGNWAAGSRIVVYGVH